MNQPTRDDQTAEAPPAHEPGETIGPGQDWVLERLLARDAPFESGQAGGCGASSPSNPSSEIWLARDRHAAAVPRAFKIFTGPGAADWLGRRQNALWSAMHALWGHTNIVRLLDVGLAGRAERGHPFIAMEYVAGGSLREWITQAPERRPPLQKREVLRGVVSALAEAHRQGIHHGGLYPARILLTRPPQVRAKVAGFGLTDAAADGEDVPATWMYQPPENSPTPAGADVFALGVIWYQLLIERLERPPYDFADVLAAAGYDGHTIRPLARCLASPGRRFADATELDQVLGETGTPRWPPVPARCFDVSRIVSEYVRTRGARG